MAKRYYESKGGKSPHHSDDHFNDEMHHDKGGNDATGYRVGKTAPEEYYAGRDDRRRLEMQDAGMIHEDQGAIANLPQGVMIKPYPRVNHYMPEGLDDSITGVDRQRNYDGSQKDKHLFPKKV